MNPYKKLSAQHFWRKSVSGIPWFEIDPVYASSFRISQKDKVATAGSCFAQHIAKNLAKSGFNYYVTETAPDGLSSEQAAVENFGTYSARYGNLYTAKQLRQLWDRAFDIQDFDLPEWKNESNNVVDPFRPQIQPQGFATQDAMLASRRVHLECCRQMFKTLDVFVFTMGLTEGWRHKQSGAVLPLAPGVSGGVWDEDTYEFVNFDVEDIIEDMSYVISALSQLNPNCKIVLTVSPVPLMATYSDAHVLSATIYSKSVLRVAAEVLSKKFVHMLDYFPSYEIITGPATAGHYFEGDFRDISPLGVGHVMRVFFKHYLQNDDLLKDSALSSPIAVNVRSEVGAINKVVCDEEAIDKALGA